MGGAGKEAGEEPRSGRGRIPRVVEEDEDEDEAAEEREAPGDLILGRVRRRGI